MTAQEGLQGGQPEAANPLSSIIQAIRDQGPDVLDIHDIPDIKTLKLTEIGYVWPDSSCTRGTLRGDNLFAPQAAPEYGPLIVPPGASLDTATFEIERADDDKPHKVVIQAHGTLKLERPSDAPLVHRWIRKRLPALNELSRSLTACIFALFTAVLDPSQFPFTSDPEYDHPRTHAPPLLGAHPV